MQRSSQSAAVDDHVDFAPAKQGVSSIASMASAAALFPALTDARLMIRIADIERDRAQLQQLLTAPGIKQRTPEWYAAREQLITASDAAQALGCAKFGSQKQFFAKKCGYEKETFNANVPPLKWGTMYEAVACDAYSLRMGTRVYEFGLLHHPTIPFLGASPDGINELGVMVEIKCPYKRKINGEIPMQYYYQVQGQLEVTSLRSCDYMECEIQEYSDWDAMLADCSSCGKYSASGGEHGFVMELPSLLSDGASEYEYSPMRLTPEELQNHSEALMHKHAHRIPSPRLHIYKITKIGIQRIEKDDAFTSVMLAQLKDVWDRVSTYRADKELYDAEVKGPDMTPRRSRSTAAGVLHAAENAVSLSGYAFLED